MVDSIAGFWFKRRSTCLVAGGWAVEADRQGYVEMGYDWVIGTIMTVLMSIPGV